MAIWEAKVTELQAVERLYYVEADSKDEADYKAEHGETVQEETLKTSGVVQREVFEVYESKEQECQDSKSQ